MPTAALEAYYAQQALLQNSGGGGGAPGAGGGAPGAGGGAPGAGGGAPGGGGGAPGGSSGGGEGPLQSAASSMPQIYAAQLVEYMNAAEELSVTTKMALHMSSAVGHSQGLAAALSVSAGIDAETLLHLSRHARACCRRARPLAFGCV